MGQRSLPQLPSASSLASADLYHTNQSGTDKQTTLDALSSFVKRSSSYAGVPVLITTAYSVPISPLRDLLITAVVASSSYTVSFPSITATAVPLRVVIVRSGVGSGVLTISGLNNNGGSIALYNDQDSIVVEAVQTGTSTYGWQLVSVLSNGTPSTSAATYSLAAADRIRTVNFTTGTSSVVANLPAASSVVPGERYTFSKVDSGTGTVSLTPNVGETISGLTVLPLSHQWESATIISTGSGWIWVSTTPTPPVYLSLSSGSPYTLSTSPAAEVDITTGASSYVLNLPTAAIGMSIRVRKVDTAAGKVQITPNGTDTINGVTGAAAWEITDQWGFVALEAVTGGWGVVGNKGTTYRNVMITAADVSVATANTWYNLGESLSLNPGVYRIRYCVVFYANQGATVAAWYQSCLSTANNSMSDAELSAATRLDTGLKNSLYHVVEKIVNVASATTFYLNVTTQNSVGTSFWVDGSYSPVIITAERIG